MIEVKDVVKTFDGFRALDGVTMTVPRGAVYGLVGPNGAGKSTLIRHLTGIYRPDSGVIDIDGQPCTKTRPSRRASLTSRTTCSISRRRRFRT